jgi:hypothetical protein
MCRLVKRSVSFRANPPLGDFGVDCEHIRGDRLQRASGSGVWGALHAAQFFAGYDDSIPGFQRPIRPDLLLRCDCRGFEPSGEHKLQSGVGDNSHALDFRANVVFCVPKGLMCVRNSELRGRYPKRGWPRRRLPREEDRQSLCQPTARTPAPTSRLPESLRRPGLLILFRMNDATPTCLSTGSSLQIRLTRVHRLDQFPRSQKAWLQ